MTRRASRSSGVRGAMPAEFDTPIGRLGITHKAGCAVLRGEGCDCGPTLSVNGERLTAAEVKALTAEAEARAEAQGRLMARIDLKHEPDCGAPHALHCQCEVRFTLDGKTLPIRAKEVRLMAHQHAQRFSLGGLAEEIDRLTAWVESAEAALAQDPVPPFRGEAFTHDDLVEFIVATRVSIAILRDRLRADLAALRTQSDRAHLHVPKGRPARKLRGTR